MEPGLETPVEPRVETPPGAMSKLLVVGGAVVEPVVEPGLETQMSKLLVVVGPVVEPVVEPGLEPQVSRLLLHQIS